MEAEADLCSPLASAPFVATLCEVCSVKLATGLLLWVQVGAAARLAPSCSELSHYLTGIVTATLKSRYQHAHFLK